mmetsp:Transcript_108844/g.281343  ORF Transcript_108844/g.281343 Transcript_108844/m.281343 type:complete len:213 (-) Transcript_108844:1195-1833(-)
MPPQSQRAQYVRLARLAMPPPGACAAIGPRRRHAALAADAVSQHPRVRHAGDADCCAVLCFPGGGGASAAEPAAASAPLAYASAVVVGAAATQPWSRCQRNLRHSPAPPAAERFSRPHRGVPRTADRRPNYHGGGYSFSCLSGGPARRPASHCLRAPAPLTHLEHSPPGSPYRRPCSRLHIFHTRNQSCRPTRPAHSQRACPKFVSCCGQRI